MSDIRSQFSKPKYGQKGGHSNFSVEEDKANVYRILPPMKSGTEDGRWAIYLAQHFGYKGVDKSDPNKEKARPFACPKKEDYKTKMVLVDCDECIRVAEQRDILEQKEHALKEEGRTDEEIGQILAVLKGWVKNHNQDRKWYINVMSLDGKFGVLRIAHKHKLALDAAIKLVQENHGIDPLDIDAGVWFDFRRSGRGPTTNHTVTPVTETVNVNGRNLMAIKGAALTDAQLEQAFKECPDLKVENLMRVVSPEQVRLLVKGSGDPEEVDKVFGLSQNADREKSPTPVGKPQVKPTVKVEAPAPAKAPAPVVDDLDAQIARLQAQKAAKAPKPAPQNLSEEDFDALFPDPDASAA
jgi:hypothetical protein